MVKASLAGEGLTRVVDEPHYVLRGGAYRRLSAAEVAAGEAAGWELD